MPVSNVIYLDHGVILQHEMEYDLVYSWDGPVASIPYRQRQRTLLSTDGGETWRPIEHYIFRQDEDGRASIEVLDEPPRAGHWTAPRQWVHGEIVTASWEEDDAQVLEIDVDSSQYEAAVERAARMFNADVSIEDDGPYQGDDSGVGMTLEELLGNIDSVLDDHEANR